MKLAIFFAFLVSVALAEDRPSAEDELTALRKENAALKAELEKFALPKSATFIQQVVWDDIGAALPENHPFVKVYARHLKQLQERFPASTEREIVAAMTIAQRELRKKDTPVYVLEIMDDLIELIGDKWIHATFAEVLTLWKLTFEEKVKKIKELKKDGR
jgi:hypothetical protein